jgi:cell division protease FtsH
VLSPEERKRAAFHESGHAIVAAASGRLEQVHRVSILARGRSLGTTALQRDDSALQTRSDLVTGIVIALGGIAAEVLLFGEPSTGAEDDLQFATDQATDVVGRFGMGARRRRLLARAEDELLGEAAALGHVSALTHQEMEAEVDRLIEGAEEEAAALLTRHRDVLAALAERLEAEETIEGPDLESILALVRPEVTLFGGLVAERRREVPAASAEAEGA